MFEEKRKYDRKFFDLDVYEKSSGNHLGSASNINHDGLLLVSKEEIPLFKNISISLQIPERRDCRFSLVVSGMWRQRYEDSVLDFFNTGCQIIETSSDVISVIDYLCMELDNGTISPDKFSLFLNSAIKK